MIDTPWHQLSKEASFLQSALTLENQYQPLEAFFPWFEHRLQANDFAVEQLALTDLDEWYFAENLHRLAHRSGKFFTIEGIRVQSDYGPVTEWDQPIINQPEVGILGILTQVVGGVRYFLMQLKMEPGNVNLLQLSPTVQATRSNYTQVHNGRLPHYLEYFIQHGRSTILVDQLQSEQGSRFLYKQNRNMVIEVQENVPLHDDFCWLTLGEIKKLLTIDNLVNMDSRTVLSCIPLAHPDWGFYHAANSHYQSANPAQVFGYQLTGFPKDLFLSAVSVQSRHTVDQIISWFVGIKTRHELAVQKIPLRDLRGWRQNEQSIAHETGQYFSVIGVAVQAKSREVLNWRQPLLKHASQGIVGFITQRLDGVLHFLVRASIEPGNRDMLELGPTVACSEPIKRDADKLPLFLDLFLQAPAEQVRFNVVQSEEGGRFYHFQNRHMILQLPDEAQLEVPSNFIWMTLKQITDFTKHSYFNIEARNLLSCLSLLEAN